jgi:hypothetical protein
MEYKRRNYRNKVFNKIIIYDTVSLKRTVIPFTAIYGTELKENMFNALFTTDTNGMHKSFGAHCEQCNQKSICYASLFDPELRKHIEVEKMITPFDWENEMDVYKGATFNLGHNISQMLIFRPHNEFEEFKNCYLVGGGTHPGSGLPTIYQSGIISADLILKRDGKI